MSDAAQDHDKELERQAQLLANDIVREAKEENPSIDQLELKRIKRKALADARRQVGITAPGTAKKRTSVPPVEKQKAPPIPENLSTDETTEPLERTPVMNYLNNAVRVLKENKTVIARKALVAVGAAAGMAITSTLVDRLGDRRTVEPDIVVITPETEIIYTDPDQPDTTS